jgi:PhzF family phenazine biosynthesis protein
MSKDNYIPIFQVDAFADSSFKGNPAAVCVIDKPLDDITMQNIAMEMNLTETAFAIPAHKSGILNADRFAIRWFTPTCETSLCGHATLAAAKVLFEIFENKSETLVFHSQRGEIFVTRRGQFLQLDFLAVRPEPTQLSEYMADALRLDIDGLRSDFMDASHDSQAKLILLRFKDVSTIKAVTPDFFELFHVQQALGYEETIITARDYGDYDFISRSFAPILGIDEDPVSGEAHTILAPYWSALLNKKNLVAYQASKRGGEILIEVREDPKRYRDRVILSGKAVIVMEGIINIESNLNES